MCFAEIRRFFGQEGGGPIRAWKEAAAAPPLDLGALQSVPWGTASPLPKPKGHVVAVRITSEDPDDGFKPTCGKVDVSALSGPAVHRSQCCLRAYKLGLCQSLECQNFMSATPCVLVPLCTAGNQLPQQTGRVGVLLDQGGSHLSLPTLDP